MEKPQITDSDSSGGSSSPSMALKPFELSELDSSATPDAVVGNMAEVELDLRVELGTTQLSLSQIMRLRRGSVIPIDVAISEPVRLYADEQLVALGEVMVLNDQFCIRVTELVQGEDLLEAEQAGAEREIENAA